MRSFMVALLAAPILVQGTGGTVNEALHSEAGQKSIADGYQKSVANLGHMADKHISETVPYVGNEAPKRPFGARVQMLKTSPSEARAFHQHQYDKLHFDYGKRLITHKDLEKQYAESSKGLTHYGSPEQRTQKFHEHDKLHQQLAHSEAAKDHHFAKMAYHRFHAMTPEQREAEVKQGGPDAP